MANDPRFTKHLTSLHKHAIAERGVLYFSSVPTDMRPNEVRLHFQQFGEVLRQKFVPYTIKHSTSGKRLNAMQFKEGWLEFKNQADAVRAATLLNSKPVGVRRFRKAHGQTWNVKFLPDFSWDRLIEDKETAVRERKVREYKEKESERSANEMFRALVAAKSKRALAAKRQREEEEGIDETEAVVEEVTEPVTDKPTVKTRLKKVEGAEPQPKKLSSELRLKKTKRISSN
eukprot:GILI01013307.1.p1 GENE.GILI01013307.1~~GILI01013307.1.p1  ORF type:complete len:230 (-),score=23.36 GILI01013307.1:25-714(-)